MQALRSSVYVQSLIAAHEVGGTFKASLSFSGNTLRIVSMVILNLIKLTMKINHQNTVYIKLQVKSFLRSL